MLPDRVSNPGPLTYESGALPIALRGPANNELKQANLSNQATSLTEKNGWIRQVVGIQRLEKHMENFNRPRFLSRLDRKLE